MPVQLGSLLLYKTLQSEQTPTGRVGGDSSHVTALRSHSITEEIQSRNLRQGEPGGRTEAETMGEGHS